MSFADPTKLQLIDFEYGIWNPEMYDLADFLIECISDNAHVNGIAMFVCNWPTDEEIQSVVRRYCQLGGSSFDLASRVHEVHQCMVLYNFFFAMWTVLVLSEADERDRTAWHWDYILGRCKVHQLCLEKYDLGRFPK